MEQKRKTYLNIYVVANFVDFHVSGKTSNTMVPELPAEHVARTAPISFRISHGAWNETNQNVPYLHLQQTTVNCIGFNH